MSRGLRGKAFGLLFFVFGGSMQAEERGSFYVENALVHYILPEVRFEDRSVVMVPGLNLSSYIYLETPDGRRGWAQQFADAGYSVYVINDPAFDFSRGFGVEGFAEVPTEGAPAADPSSEQGWQRDIWSRWGFGSSSGNPYPDTLFPAEAFDNFAANYPYIGGERRDYADAIVALVDQVGASILMGHSAGGPPVVEAASRRPERVSCLILVEPTGPPDSSDFPTLSGMSMYGVYGDYIDSRNQGSRKASTEAAAALFVQNGGKGEVLSLPEDLEIFGNTHLLMQDENNLFIANLMLDWLSENVVAAAPAPRISTRDMGVSVEFRSDRKGIWRRSEDLEEWRVVSEVPSDRIELTSEESPVFFEQATW